MKPSRTFAPLAVAVALTPAVAVASQQDTPGGVVVEASRQVTTGTDPVRLHVSPQVAVHPADPSTVALGVGDARGGGCGIRLSRDGGLSWAAVVDNALPDEFSHCVQRNYGPVVGVAIAGDDTIHLGLSGSAVSSGHPNGPIAALHSRAPQLGGSHETVVVAPSRPYTHRPEEGPPVAGFEQHNLNSVAVDPDDPRVVYRGWRWRAAGDDIPNNAVPERPWVAVSRDGGRTWADPVDLLTSSGLEVYGANVPMLAVAADGTVHAVARERPRPPAEGPRPNARFLLFSSTDHGETWTGRIVYDEQPFLTSPVLGVDPTGGALYLTWSQWEGAGFDGPSEIMFMSSADGGETWTDPVKLADDDPAGKYNKYWPGLGVAPNGRIDVAWHDFRNDPFYVAEGSGPMGLGSTTQRWSDLYYTYSTDGGRTWSANVRVTDRSVDRKKGVTFNNQDIVGPVGIASTDDAALLAWADSRGAGGFDAEDAYFTRVRHVGGAVPAAGPAASPLVWGVLGGAGGLVLGGAVLLVAVLGAGRRRPTAAVRARG